MSALADIITSRVLQGASLGNFLSTMCAVVKRLVFVDPASLLQKVSEQTKLKKLLKKQSEAGHSEGDEEIEVLCL